MVNLQRIFEILSFVNGYIAGGVVCYFIMKNRKPINNVCYSPEYKDKLANNYNAIFDTRKKAEDGLTILNNCVHNYGFATVSDLKEYCGGSYTMFKDCKIGWTDLKKALIIQTRSGYLLELPEPIDITKEAVKCQSNKCDIKS